MSTVKIGLFGLGHLGKIHLRLLKESVLFEIIGIYDIDSVKGKKIAEESGVAFFENPHQLINEVDAIDIVTPTLSHHIWAKAALSSGKHVFIEKPITTTVTEAEELTLLAKEHLLVGQVGHVERFNPALLALEGTPIQPLFIEGHRLALWNPRGTDVSVVLDLMIHDLDVVLSLVKSPVKSVQASGVPIVSPTPDIANARIAFENGCVCNLTASRISLKNMRRLRLFQKDAYVAIDFLDKKVERVHITNAPPTEETGLSMPIEVGDTTRYIQASMPDVQPINAIKMELEEFAQSILFQKPVRVDFSSGKDALTLAYRIIEEIEKNR